MAREYHECCDGSGKAVFNAPQYAPSLPGIQSSDHTGPPSWAEGFGKARRQISGVRHRGLMLEYPLCREHNKDVTGGAAIDILCLIPGIRKVLKFHKIGFHQGNA